MVPGWLPTVEDSTVDHPYLQVGPAPANEPYLEVGLVVGVALGAMANLCLDSCADCYSESMVQAATLWAALWTALDPQERLVWGDHYATLMRDALEAQS